MPTQHLLIKGTVQGVYYRVSAKEVADAIGLTGWIRNTPEGHVEALVNGMPYQLQDFVDWCRKGPSGAVVTGVDVENRPEESFAGFRIIRG
ncbi:MAG: acylphosphatase [Chitinophagaceae bacterium]|nr:MAG: acylphosphatase [Chitinophagaceae bacterium]